MIGLKICRCDYITRHEIRSRIYTLRNKELMLDEDLAELYEIDIKVFNQAVKRNIESFPDDFMFQLSENTTIYALYKEME